MFLMYSVDVPYDRRPWLGYLLFPVIVAISFYLAGNDQTPELSDIGIHGLVYICPLSAISPLLLLIYFVSSFIVLWLFGNAVCSKVGNIAYVVLLIVFAAMVEGVNFLSEEVVIWMPGCILNVIVGMYLMYWPTNSVDCVFLIPPWKGFTVSGFWVVVAWIILDFISVALLGWPAALIAHPLCLLAGLITATILTKLQVAAVYDDDWTLLQIITHQEKDDTAWQDSWSIRRNQTDKDETESEEKHQEALKAESPKPNAQKDVIPLLCQCGHIIRVPEKYQGRKVRCPLCSHVITVPKSD